MNNNDRADIFSSFILIFVGVIMGYLCFVVAEYYTKWLAILMLLVDIVIIAMLYKLIRDSHINMLKFFLKRVVKDVNSISYDMEFEKPDTKLFNNEITELYGAIEEIKRTQMAQDKSKDSMLNIINSIAINIELETLLDDMLPKIIDGTGSNWGAFYLNNFSTEKMELKSAVGFSKNLYNEFDISLGEGFVGKTAMTDKIQLFNDIPDDTVYVAKTFLGKIKPKSIMTVPIAGQGGNVAVLLLASIYEYTEEHVETVKLIRYYLGSAITNGITFERTKRLKNELLFQNQLIQNMNEELENKVEERTKFLNSVLDSIRDYAIISMDEDGYITTWNTGAEKMRGILAEEAIGKSIIDTYSAEEKAESEERLEKAKTAGKYEGRMHITRKDGTSIYVDLILTAIYDEKNELRGFTSIFREI